MTYPPSSFNLCCASALTAVDLPGRFRPHCRKYPVIESFSVTHPRFGRTTSGLCISQIKAPVVCPCTGVYQNKNKAEHRQLLEVGSACGSGIETTGWGARSEIPAGGYSVAAGSRPAGENQALSLAPSAGGLALAVSFSGEGRCRRVGFSLVELLVVISIIVLLASLLLPVLSRAKAKAHAMTCINNERQIYLAWNQLVSDSNDVLPYSDTWVNTYNQWWLAEETWMQSPLKDYIGKSDDTWRCPDYKYFDYGRTDFNYSMNFAIGGNSWDPAEQLFDPPMPIKFYHKMGELSRDASRWFLLMDWRRDFSPGSSWAADPWHWNNPNGFSWFTLPAAQHGHGAALVFVDGAALVHHWRDPRTWPIPFTWEEGQPDPLIQPGSVDVAWIQQHSSRLKNEGPNVRPPRP